MGAGMVGADGRNREGTQRPRDPNTAFALTGGFAGVVSILLGVHSFLLKFSSGEPFFAAIAIVVVLGFVGAAFSAVYLVQFRRLFNYYGEHPTTIDVNGPEDRRVRSISYLTVLSSVSLALSLGGIMFVFL